MKKIIFIFLMSVTSLLHAGAAEKWEYEPVMKDMNIHVTAHKVDQYGTAVNDYEYNTKIDPKSYANKTKMGTVGMGRLLKTTGWGLLGSAALEALLESVDWVIDPEAQSIWRNKKDSNSSYTCTYKDSYGKILLFQGAYGEPSRCPLTAAENFLRELNPDYKFIRWLDNPSTAIGDYRFTHTFEINGVNLEDVRSITSHPDPDQSQAELPKEYLTPEQLADYANHTHPDYSNPELAPKLAPKYSPEIASDLWKPSNPWEETNSPTVQEVNKKLDEAQPEPKKDPELTPNPETGGMTLPSFCTWAASVCEFIKWVKDDSDLDNSDIDTPDTDVLDREFDTSFTASASCPPNPSIQITDDYNMELPFNKICDFFGFLKAGVIAASSLTACWIVSAAVRGGD